MYPTAPHRLGDGQVEGEARRKIVDGDGRPIVGAAYAPVGLGVGLKAGERRRREAEDGWVGEAASLTDRPVPARLVGGKPLHEQALK